MNGKQLFYSFLPGVTVAVLASHSSYANTAKIGEPTLVASGINIFDSIPVFKSNILHPQMVFDNTFVTKTINLQAPFQFNEIRAVNNPSSIISSKLIGSTDILWLEATSKKLIAKSATENDENLLLTLVEFYGEEPKELILNKLDILNLNIKDLVRHKNTTSEIMTVAQAPSKKLGAKALIETPTPAQNQIAQNTQQNVPPPRPTNPTPVAPPTIPSSGTREIPSYLNANPNPLQFPTRPEEVRLEGTQRITLNQALEAARRNNKQLQVALLQVERSQAAVREAQAALLPTLGLNANITRQRSAQSRLGSEAQIRENPAFADQFEGVQESTGFSGNAQFNYDLYTSGRRQAIIRQAEEQLRSDEFNLEVQSETIRLNVTNQYYDLQQADESVRINESAVENAQASLRDALALERAGVGTRFDVLQFQVDLANSQQQRTIAISQQQIAQRQLAATLSVPQSVNLSAADPVAIAGLWNQTLEASIIQALQNRPELQQQLAQRNIGEQQRRQALSALGPQISLVAQYNLLDQFQDQISVVDGYSVGVQASIPLYEGGAARARASQAQRAISIAETQFAEQRNQIRFQVEQAFSQLQSNLSNIQTANVALEQATEALRLARLRFQAGVGTQTDVINAQNRLTQSEGNRVTAILGYNRALATIQRAVTARGTR
ncbi:TolC family protein [Dulcicalothrix desertica]|uniref:TolC family protein n=1 Tax=Dulcicalothrix desertica TaxID=32056 RepID=UPI00119A538D|nr:TolC family protein [Dulcicalothrix desertica]TWH51301.1 OMF family outer membrane factor [Dulcicalothrix desertica PCC 7102]